MASSRERMVLCVRCPDSASAHLSRHDNDFAKCQKEHPLIEFPLDGQTYIEKKSEKKSEHESEKEPEKTPEEKSQQDHANKRWWGFLAGAVDTKTIDLTQRNTCIALLAEAKAVAPIVRKTRPPSDAELTATAELKAKSMFRGISITKDMLETALRIASRPEERGGSDTQAVDPTAGASAPVSSSGNDGAALDQSSNAEASSAGPQSTSGPSRAVQDSAAPHIAWPSSASPTTATSSTAMPTAQTPTMTPAAPSTEIDNGMSMLHLQSQPETEVQASGSNTPRATTAHNPPKRAPPEVASTPPAHPSTAHHERPNSGVSSRPKAPIVGHARTTPSGQPVNLDGELKVNENEAKKKTAAFAMAYGQEQNPPKGEDEVMKVLGLRKEFARKEWTFKVLTNYIQMQLPTKLYVYKVEMIRDWSNNGRILVKRFADKKAVIEFLARPPGILQMDRRDWVTDGDLIWSCKPLFSEDRQVDNVPYLNECGRPLTVKKVIIIVLPSIDCRQPVSELFPVGSNSLPANKDPPILLRGLNAILTESARSRNVPFTSGNKGYLTQLAPPPAENNVDRPADLSLVVQSLPGFFLSVRPGVDRLLLNINNARSPFFKAGMTVQNVYVAATRATPPNRRTPQEIGRIMKGVKVRINYGIRSNPVDPDPQGRRRMRFVKQIRGTISQQPCSPPESVNGRVTMVSDWFLGQSERNHEFFPVNRRQLNVQATDVAVEVATDSRPDSSNTEWYPASTLLIEPNQPWHGDLTPQETANMIRGAQLPPDQSHRAITNDGLRMFDLHTTALHPWVRSLSRLDVVEAC